MSGEGAGFGGNDALLLGPVEAGKRVSFLRNFLAFFLSGDVMEKKSSVWAYVVVILVIAAVGGFIGQRVWHNSQDRKAIDSSLNDR